MPGYEIMKLLEEHNMTNFYWRIARRILISNEKDYEYSLKREIEERERYKKQLIEIEKKSLDELRKIQEREYNEKIFNLERYYLTQQHERDFLELALKNCKESLLSPEISILKQRAIKLIEDEISRYNLAELSLEISQLKKRPLTDIILHKEEQIKFLKDIIKTYDSTIQTMQTNMLEQLTNKKVFLQELGPCPKEVQSDF